MFDRRMDSIFPWNSPWHCWDSVRLSKLYRAMKSIMDFLVTMVVLDLVPALRCWIIKKNTKTTSNSVRIGSRHKIIDSMQTHTVHANIVVYVYMKDLDHENHNILSVSLKFDFVAKISNESNRLPHKAQLHNCTCYVRHRYTVYCAILSHTQLHTHTHYMHNIFERIMRYTICICMQ